MLALLAVATLAASEPAVAPADASSPPIGRLLFDPQARGFLRSPSHCKDAARIETGFEPTLLFREQDRAAARARRLIDLPPAEACLVGAPLNVRSALK